MSTVRRPRGAVRAAPDGRPRLDERDIDDLVAFLRTLTDADAQAAAGAITGHPDR